MWVCRDCRNVWGAPLRECGRCRGAVTPLGDDPADFDLPVINRFPMRSVITGRRPPSSHAIINTPMSDRNSAAEWRAFIAEAGHPDASVLTKAEAMSWWRSQKASA